ncbi:hypothetical protein M422DRAFT_186615, partial [Sphaerobolus stellatus SS14]
ITWNNPDPVKRGLVQSMKFPKDLLLNHPYYAFKGQHKGMRVTLEERGLLDVLRAANSASTTCCLRKSLECQQDFGDEKPLLQQIIENAGHKCYFIPKFHCELNPIEMYWRCIKIHESG